MREIYIEEPSSSEPNEGNCSLFFYCLACIHVDILRLICWARSIYSQASPLQFLYDSIYPQFNSLQTCNTVLNILGKTVMKVFFSFQVILVKTAANLAWHCKSCLAWFCRTCFTWFCRTCLAWHCSAIPRIAQSAASIPAIAQSGLINSNHNHVLIRIPYITALWYIKTLRSPYQSHSNNIFRMAIYFLI
jgi:hypothetical protein